MKNCTQIGCDYPALFRFAWPGKDGAYACAIHATAALEIAKAIDLPLQMILLTPAELVADDEARLDCDDGDGDGGCP